MSDEINAFAAVDYVVFAIMLAVSAGIGIFYACWGDRQKTTGEFLMGNRNMQVLPVAISILFSFVSAIMVLGTPAEMYTSGTEYYMSIFGVSLGAGLAVVLFVPLLYPLNITSAFEYLERRFNSRAAKRTGTIIMIIQQVLYMGVASYAPSTALEAVTGFPTWATIITVGLVSTFYTTLGGMKAVVWTDVFQAVVMVVGLLAVLIQGSMNVGGMDEVWRINAEWGRVQFFDFNPDPTVRHTFWSLVVGGAIGTTSMLGVNQASVQRYCALPSLNKARISILLNIFGMFILLTIVCLVGISVFAYYARIGCDPLTANYISNPNQIIPYFVMDVLGYPGLPGLFVACLFSGALSSMSSSLNALSAICWEDFLKPSLQHKLTEGQKTVVTKCLVLLFGGVGIAFGFMAQTLGGTVLQASLSFVGGASGPVLGLFVLGGFFPWANWKGAVVGGILGLVMPMWIGIGAYTVTNAPSDLEYPTYNCSSPNITQDILTTTMSSNDTVIPTYTGMSALYTISYLWYPAIGVATVVVVGLVVSALTGMNHIGDVDTKYLIPVFDRLFCCLPSVISKPLRCYQEFEEPETIKREEKDVELVALPLGEIQITTKPLFPIVDTNDIPVKALSYKLKGDINNGIDTTPVNSLDGNYL